MKKWIASILLVVFSAASAWAQDLHAIDEDVIRIDVALVTVSVSVTDTKGRALSDLNAGDFHLTDQGKSVSLQFFDSKGPASIVFVIDLSSSMRAQWDSLKKAMKKF